MGSTEDITTTPRCSISMAADRDRDSSSSLRMAVRNGFRKGRAMVDIRGMMELLNAVTIEVEEAEGEEDAEGVRISTIGMRIIRAMRSSTHRHRKHSSNGTPSKGSSRSRG